MENLIVIVKSIYRLLALLLLLLPLLLLFSCVVVVVVVVVCLLFLLLVLGSGVSKFLNYCFRLLSLPKLWSVDTAL